MRADHDRSVAIASLRAAIPYLRLFQGRTFVIKAGGAIFDDPAACRHLLEQVGVLHQVGIKTVLVHGGGGQTTALAERLGCETRFVAGRRVTSPETLSASIESAYLEQRGFSVSASTTTYSINAGLWGVTIGGKETGGTSEGLPEEAWVRTRGAFDQPKPAAPLSIGFTAGVPSSLNGKAMGPVALIEALDALAASYGIGRGIHLGDTILGAKGRVAFEAPAATVLVQAHRELEKLTLSAGQMRLKESLAQVYGDMVHEGKHAMPECRDVEALFTSTQRRVTGVVKLTLRQGAAFVEGATAPQSLHAASKSIYGEAVGEWSPEDAKGYSKLLALPGVLWHRAEEASS